ncbi:hypothetical protein VTP01DRAFT_5773 [Rhizomucor pusillus]|uniref:uncharacterized protein n=1 Tax=Rhizomucor pusillus TaxID=4840 RepID=UPI0037435B5A
MQRQAVHAGSWYSDSTTQLDKELSKYLDAVPVKTDDGDNYPIPGVRAIIGPHAGYAYSGPTAAYAYKCVDVSPIKRVFILGPSHHVYLTRCALSRCDTYETPLGTLELDKDCINELYNTGKFEWMDKSTDEAEHSIEMHLPYVAKIFKDRLNDIRIVPIMVGVTRPTSERMYGELLAKYLADASTLFVISSDFCHWGLRFSYTAYRTGRSAAIKALSRTNASNITTPIHESIKDIDTQGMEIIESLDYDAFVDYLNDTENTICGRHPIGVLLCALSQLKAEGYKDQRVRFVKYAQSSACRTVRESSVSYASAFVYVNLEK